MRAAVAVLAAGLVLAGCRFDGIDSMPLPGGVGTGDDAIVVTAELPDVGTLTTNAQVKVDEVVVGTVTGLDTADWHAVATLSLEPDVDLPADVVASVGVNSLLGSAYVELAPAPYAGPGTLATGDVVPLEHGNAYPSTEQVLSSASLVLNGGGLGQLSTITTELNRALGGEHAVGDLLPRLESFVGALDAQREDILSAIEDVDALAARYSRSRGDIVAALDVLGPALRTLADERPQLTAALTSLKRLGDVAVPLVDRVEDDVVANLQDITPALQALRRADRSLVRGLGFAVTFPFAPETVTNACRGDYCNLFLTLDLTNDAITNGFITPEGTLDLPGFPGLPDLPVIPLPLDDLLWTPNAGGLLGGAPAGSTSPVDDLLGQLGLKEARR